MLACKQGDQKAVKKLLVRGAKPNMADAKGEQPLGAAVWSMCPGVVDALLEWAGGVAPMTWDECEEHNLKYYREVFIVPKFDPQIYSEWYQLLQKIDCNPFISSYYLQKYYNSCDRWHWTETWEQYKKSFEISVRKDPKMSVRMNEGLVAIEAGYAGLRAQIKQGIETARRPSMAQTFGGLIAG